jgi:hypothetical protein
MILFFLLVPLFLTVPGIAADREDIKFPVIENVSLLVDGSVNPVLVNLTEPFDFVQRFVINVIWTKNTIIFDDFGTLVGGLINGTQFLYNSTVFGTVNSIADFGTLSYNVRIDTDDSGVKQNHLYSRLSFFKFVDADLGLDVQGFDFQFRVRDDNAAAVDDFFITVQGFRLLDAEASPDPTTAVNPFDYFNTWALWLLTQPLTYFMIIVGFGTIWILVKHR